jgi:hypothetical protein
MAFILTSARLMAVLLASFSLSAALGQAGARPHTAYLQPLAHKKDRATPPQMEKLIDALTGQWATVDTYEATEPTSPPRVAHGLETYRVGPARMSLIEEYHAEDSAGKVWGTGILWWDDKAQGVHVLWCDSDPVARGCRVVSGIGKWEGNDFIQTDVNDASGKPVVGREVWSDLKRDSFTQTVYQGAEADKLQKILTIKATRKR